jgi:hypothetical protein
MRYRTSPIGALSTHFKGGFYHDGRFPDLNAVVEHYNTSMRLGLTQGEKSDLIQYLTESQILSHNLHARETVPVRLFNRLC